jgi:quinol monooxygenase YgiN
MAKTTVRFIVSFTVNDGQFESFDAVAREMTALTVMESGTLVYDWYLSPDQKHCRLYESYVDGSAALAHMTGRVVQELVPKLLGFSAMSGFEVYGDPGQAAGQLLAGAGASLFQPWHAIGR